MRRCLAVSACLMAVPAAAQTVPTDEAVAAIALPEPQLRGMLAATIFSTQSMAMASYTLGVPATCAVTRPAFEQAVQKVLPRWRTNLIGAYRSNTPADALARASAGSLVESGPVMAPYLSAIGAAMKRDSEPLLKEAGESVLLAVLGVASRQDIKKVDGAKRVVEMKAAQADGSLFCGLTGARP